MKTEKKIEMSTRRVSIVDDDGPFDLNRVVDFPDYDKLDGRKPSRHQGSILMVLAVLILVVVGTGILASWIHFQCTREGGFTLFHHSYTCKLVSDTAPALQPVTAPKVLMTNNFNSKGLA